MMIVYTLLMADDTATGHTQMRFVHLENYFALFSFFHRSSKEEMHSFFSGTTLQMNKRAKK